MPIKNLKKTAQALKKNNTFLIICHIDPDGDTIGSALGLKFILQKLGKQANVCCTDPIPDVYKFLPGISLVKNCLTNPNKVDCIVTVDASDLKRIYNPEKLLPLGKVVINIDHHSDNTYYGHLNLVADASSAAELIYNLARALKVKLDNKAANCLYVAMMTDTGNFKYENTTARTFGIARELVLAGANPSKTATRVYEERPYTAFAIHAYTAMHTKHALKGKITWSIVTRKIMKKLGSREEDLSGIVDRLRSIKGVEVAILMREHGSSFIKVNFRSKRKVNVQKIAKALGGGGHPRSSGAVIEGSIKEVEKKVINTVLKHVK